MVARVFIYCENETRGSPSRSTRAAVASVLEPSNCLRHCRRRPCLVRRIEPCSGTLDVYARYLLDLYCSPVAGSHLSRSH
jgi:hypothetical protein